MSCTCPDPRSRAAPGAVDAVPQPPPDALVPPAEPEAPTAVAPPCPECEATDVSVEAVVGSEPVIRYYRCSACRHEWGVPEPVERIDDLAGDPDPLPS